MPRSDASERAQDWTGYLAGDGAIERTVVDSCDACDATGEVHVIGPCGGVLAFCVDTEACVARQRAAG
jgi:hypothetical protein